MFYSTNAFTVAIGGLWATGSIVYLLHVPGGRRPSLPPGKLIQSNLIVNPRPHVASAAALEAAVLGSGLVCTAKRHIAYCQLAPDCNAEPEGAVSDPGLVGVPTPVPATPFADANEETILSTNSNRMGLGDFTRNDGEALFPITWQVLGGTGALHWQWGAKSDRFFLAPE